MIRVSVRVAGALLRSYTCESYRISGASILLQNVQPRNDEEGVTDQVLILEGSVEILGNNPGGRVNFVG